MRIEPYTWGDLDDLPELEPENYEAVIARLRWHLSTPYAIAIKAVFGEVMVGGAGMAVAHEGSGWIGERLMMPRFRTAVLESQLINALCVELKIRGCHTILSLANEEQRTHLERLGFTEDGCYVRYAGGKCEWPTMDEVGLCEPYHSMGIIRLDRMVSGEDRRTLLSEHFYAGRVLIGKGRTLGYYLPLLGDGLIIAEQPWAGLELLRWHLPHVTEVVLPEANSGVLEFLQERGYTEQGREWRMVLGDRLPWRPEMIFGRIGGNLG